MILSLLSALLLSATRKVSIASTKARKGADFTSLNHFTEIFGESKLLDVLRGRRFDDFAHVDAWDVYIFWDQVSYLDDLICFHNRNDCILAHDFVEFIMSLAELAIAKSVGFVRAKESMVSKDCLLHDIFFTFEYSSLLWF